MSKSQQKLPVKSTLRIQ